MSIIDKLAKLACYTQRRNNIVSEISANQTRFVNEET
jgi:hypothetical protein